MHFVLASSISLENFKDLALIIPEILELIKLHTYKFGLVYFFFLISTRTPCNHGFPKVCDVQYMADSDKYYL